MLLRSLPARLITATLIALGALFAPQSALAGHARAGTSLYTSGATYRQACAQASGLPAPQPATCTWSPLAADPASGRLQAAVSIGAPAPGGDAMSGDSVSVDSTISV